LAQYLSEDIRKFIIENIDSVEQLEILLLLHRESARAWDPDEISREMRGEVSSILKRLDALFDKRLLWRSEDVPPKYRYSPQSQGLSEIVDRLAVLYPEMRFRIINLIFSKPIDVLRTFADAFKIKKDDSNG
jgi:hypothetical protein